MKPFSLQGKKYDYGTVLIPVQHQKLTSSNIYELLKKITKKTGVNINAANTGLTEGINLGSSNFKTLTKPVIAVVVGEGITPYDAGEIWHLLDTRYHIPVTKLDTRNMSNADLSKFTTIIIPSTTGYTLNSASENLKTFVKKGGTLIGYQNTIKWLKNTEFIKLTFKKPILKTSHITFDKRQDFRGAQHIGGAIFEAEIDRSHPINFGYNHNKIALFRNTTLFIQPDSTSRYTYPIQYTKKPLLSGYISKENLKAIGKTIPFKASKLGKGTVIIFTDNTNFRAFWYGTNKLMMNAVFFGAFM
jgi:hypothetical protein